MTTVTAFLADRKIAEGEKDAVTRTLEERYPADHSNILVFDNTSGKVIDLDYWDALQAASAKVRGRPKIGVKAREVTLLPRHWEWLAAQPGGASAALRRLVDEARSRGRTKRQRQDAAYSFMQASCGDKPGYEEALRALYKDDAEAFSAIIAGWPDDLRTYIAQLLT